MLLSWIHLLYNPSPTTQRLLQGSIANRTEGLPEEAGAVCEEDWEGA